MMVNEPKSDQLECTKNIVSVTSSLFSIELCFTERPAFSSKNLFLLNRWFIVDKTTVKQCKYYVTLMQKAFTLLLQRHVDIGFL